MACTADRFNQIFRNVAPSTGDARVPTTQRLSYNGKYASVDTEYLDDLIKTKSGKILSNSEFEDWISITFRNKEGRRQTLFNFVNSTDNPGQFMTAQLESVIASPRFSATFRVLN